MQEKKIRKRIPFPLLKLRRRELEVAVNSLHKSHIFSFTLLFYFKKVDFTYVHSTLVEDVWARKYHSLTISYMI